MITWEILISIMITELVISVFIGKRIIKTINARANACNRKSDKTSLENQRLKQDLAKQAVN